MHTQGGSSAENRRFAFYRGGILDARCTRAGSNHQIALVGYGTFAGVPVWVFQNTWGRGWGVQGTFLTKIGSNALCTESYFVVQLNRYLGFDADSLRPLEHSEQFKRLNGSLYVDLNTRRIRYGLNGLDAEGGAHREARVSATFVTAFALLALVAAAFLYFLLLWALCPAQNVLKPAIYVRFTPVQARTHDWSHAQHFRRTRGGNFRAVGTAPQ